MWLFYCYMKEARAAVLSSRIAFEPMRSARRAENFHERLGLYAGVVSNLLATCAANDVIDEIVKEKLSLRHVQDTTAADFAQTLYY